jgi:hypothetical protein
MPTNSSKFSTTGAARLDDLQNSTAGMIAAAIPVFLDRIGMALSRRIGNGCTWTKIAEFIRAVDLPYFFGPLLT